MEERRRNSSVYRLSLFTPRLDLSARSSFYWCKVICEKANIFCTENLAAQVASEKGSSESAKLVNCMQAGIVSSDFCAYIAETHHSLSVREILLMNAYVDEHTSIIIKHSEVD